MKLFQQLLVAPAALGLLAPLAVDATKPANAAELNINGVSDYASSSEQVTSITQFSDVYPTDWAYQALSNLIERYGCVAGYPNGTYRGNRAMTRFEAAALLNACLDRVTEVTDELKRLIKEFEKELAILKGRVDGLEAKVGELEATQFSTTTKLKGKTTFVIGANTFGGDAKNVNVFNADGELVGGYPLPKSTTVRGIFDKAITAAGGTKNTEKMATLANSNLGATVFNYDQQLDLDTSFTGKDLLKVRLRTGNFQNSAFGFNASTGIGSPFGGTFATASGMEIAFEEGTIGNAISVNRLFYQFPVGSDFTVTAGGVVRQDDMLAVWPSAYPADSVLDFFTYAGAPGTYNLNLGSGAGIWWQKDAFSISANYVSANGNDGNPNVGGIATDGAAGTGTVQVAYAKDNWGLAAAYNYSSQNWGNLYQSTGTPLATQVGTLGNTNSVGVSAWWTPENAGWIPSISTGWGLNSTSGAKDTTLLGYDFDSATTQSWYVGLQWADVFLKGNSAGMAVGQQGFVTSLGLGSNKTFSGSQASDAEDVLVRDGQYAWEWWYMFQVTDNISVTPAIFYLSRPLGTATQGVSYNQFGGLVKTTFKF
ncbi:outer membrane porin [Synechococcus sp. RS9909]|uniref:iron uptake porin n=1 Tax=unclassified Synechococcus TaxID=2626047 RepID=UPI000068F93B|nr:MULTISPECIES: iron uptake porin [unclassified Synechococcus]EAQ68223.1 possible porin [Synechococcus sp. RS9917]QNI80516.1 outer membrane porin [Synechococcus sp. RS9909]